MKKPKMDLSKFTREELIFIIVEYEDYIKSMARNYDELFAQEIYDMVDYVDSPEFRGRLLLTTGEDYKLESVTSAIFLKLKRNYGYGLRDAKMMVNRERIKAMILKALESAGDI